MTLTFDHTHDLDHEFSLIRIYLWETDAVSVAGTTTRVLTSSGINSSLYSDRILIKLDICIYTHTGVCSSFNFFFFFCYVYFFSFGFACYFSVHHFC